MPRTTRVSVRISEETNAEMETQAKRLGLKKGRMVEQALLHHLQALREIPTDLVIPARLVLSDAAIADIAERIAGHNEPAEALRVLLCT